MAEVCNIFTYRNSCLQGIKPGLNTGSTNTLTRNSQDTWTVAAMRYLPYLITVCQPAGLFIYLSLGPRPCLPSGSLPTLTLKMLVTVRLFVKFCKIERQICHTKHGIPLKPAI